MYDDRHIHKSSNRTIFAPHVPVWPRVLQRPGREEICEMLQDPRSVSLQETTPEALTVESLELKTLLLQVGLIDEARLDM